MIPFPARLGSGPELVRRGASTTAVQMAGGWSPGSSAAAAGKGGANTPRRVYGTELIGPEDLAMTSTATLLARDTHDVARRNEHDVAGGRP